MYALANVPMTQAAMGISIKKFVHISGADIYTRFGIVLAVFTISYTSGPFFKSSTFDRLKIDMNRYILEKTDDKNCCIT